MFQIFIEESFIIMGYDLSLFNNVFIWWFVCFKSFFLLRWFSWWLLEGFAMGGEVPGC